MLLGNGDGTFQPATSYYAGGVPTYWFTAAAVSDVNGDGKPDVVKPARSQRGHLKNSHS